MGKMDKYSGERMDGGQKGIEDKNGEAMKKMRDDVKQGLEERLERQTTLKTKQEWSG